MPQTSSRHTETDLNTTAAAATVTVLLPPSAAKQPPRLLLMLLPVEAACAAEAPHYCDACYCCRCDCSHLISHCCHRACACHNKALSTAIAIATATAAVGTAVLPAAASEQSPDLALLLPAFAPCAPASVQLTPFCVHWQPLHSVRTGAKSAATA